MFTASSAGAIIGAVTSGAILHYFNPWMLLAASAVLGGVTITVIPLCHNAVLLMFVVVLNGCGCGFLDAGSYL